MYIEEWIHPLNNRFRLMPEVHRSSTLGHDTRCVFESGGLGYLIVQAKCEEGSKVSHQLSLLLKSSKILIALLLTTLEAPSAGLSILAVESRFWG